MAQKSEYLMVCFAVFFLVYGFWLLIFTYEYLSGITGPWERGKVGTLIGYS